MNPDSFITVAATVASGGFAAWGARSARRTKRQENRDDFTAVKVALTERIDDLKKDVAGQQAQITGQQEQITGQGAAIAWLVDDRRLMVHYIRGAGLEPPLARPIPARARPYLDIIDV